MQKLDITLLIMLTCCLFTTKSIAQQKKEISIWAVQLEKGEATPLYPIERVADDTKAGWKSRVYIQPETEFQEIEGIGGAFNEMGGEALLSLPKKQQKNILENLFGEDAAGFTFCRTAIGASDFGLDAYSYSMIPEDYQMEHFSVKRDKKYVLPYIKGALKVNPELTVFASPWSPPAWLKQSGEMEGLKGGVNKLRDTPAIYEAYALYFVKYIQAYEKNGVRIDRICIQNENDSDTKYPSCVFPAKEMLAFAKDYLLPAFEKNDIKAGVYGGTYRVVEKMDLMDFVEAEAVPGVAGVGIQYTDARFITDALSVRPGLKVFHTEGKCYNGKNSSEQASHRLEEVASYLNSGSTTFTYWNMILNETTESAWDWTQNSLLNINRSTGAVQYNPDYNAMYIISRFIKPGDVRIAAVSRGKFPLITVKAPDGTIKMLLQNTDTKDTVIEVVVGDQSIKFKAPAGEIVGLTI